MIQLPQMPPRVARLPVDHRGYPVPWFVAWPDGKPDFRVMDGRKIVEAVRFGRCWVCGEQLGAHKAFVVGPMCAVNRVSSEPPSHLECATFSAKACPFLTKPNMHRREIRMPEGVIDPAGTMIKRNPGVALVWVTKQYTPRNVGNGTLFYMGEPTQLLWFAEGREATRAEVLESINTGLPILRAEAEKDGPYEVAEFDLVVKRAMTLVPAEVP